MTLANLLVFALALIVNPEAPENRNCAAKKIVVERLTANQT
jgi:hypothetical protein